MQTAQRKEYSNYKLTNFWQKNNSGSLGNTCQELHCRGGWNNIPAFVCLTAAERKVEFSHNPRRAQTARRRDTLSPVV